MVERQVVGFTELGEKIMSLIQANLTAYSVAEFYSLIWMAVETASWYSNKPNLTKKHASNSIYTILQSNIEKISNSVWKRNKFNRITNLPESAIAKICFDNIFKVLDSGFKYKLDELTASIGNEQLSKVSRYMTLGNDKEVNKTMTLQLNIS